MKAATPYYIDYIIEKDANGTITTAYHQLVRTSDEAILRSSTDLNYIFAECFKLGICRDQVVIL